MSAALFDLTGRVALVTGASRGLGRTIALGLAEAGATVALAARDTAGLSETAALIAGPTTTIPLDVADAAACEDAVRSCVATFGAIDILVNNAGTEEVRPALQVDAALWDRILDTNLRGAFFCASAAAGQMAQAGRGGAILNIASLTSFVGVPTAAPYGASKSGLLGLTRALAAEWAPLGIRVNALAPGYYRTALTEAFYQDPAWQSAMLAKIPLGRFGDPGDLVGATIFLVSRASAYITGHCLPVDGGTLASI